MKGVSVPGKIHLIGEHTVVYGKPALISAINKRVFVTLPDFKIKSDLPIGSGMGFSAAYSAGLIAASAVFLKQKFDKNLINKLTFELEKIHHGTPSGGDNTTVVFGGIIRFQNGSFSPFKPKINKFVLIQSGKPIESTKQMVEIASKKIKSILEPQENLTNQMEEALITGKNLIEIIKNAEKNLEKIGVVGKIAKKIVKDIGSLGGAAKISGAGGVKQGSGILLVFHKNPKVILNYAKNNNLETIEVKLGAEGLRKESLL